MFIQTLVPYRLILTVDSKAKNRSGCIHLGENESKTHILTTSIYSLIIKLEFKININQYKINKIEKKKLFQMF